MSKAKPTKKKGGKKAGKPSRRLDDLIRSIALTKVMGLDDLHLGGIQDKPRQGRKYRAVLTNLEAHKFIGLFPTRRIRYLQRVLSNIPIETRKMVLVVCIDMWKPFRLLAHRVFPKAIIIIDVYHIVSKANDCLDSVRKFVQGKIVPEALDAARKKGITDQKALKDIRKEAKKKALYLLHNRWVLLHRAKELNAGDMEKCGRFRAAEAMIDTAYDLKERFYAIWDDAPDPAEARAMYAKWKASIPEEHKRFWKPALSAMTNWGDEIFNYFIEPSPKKRITNSFTERMVGRIKRINREARGCRLETIWLKLEKQKELDDRHRLRVDAKDGDEQVAAAPDPGPDCRASIESSLRMAERIASRKRARKNQSPRKRNSLTKPSAFPGQQIHFLFPSDPKESA